MSKSKAVANSIRRRSQEVEERCRQSKGRAVKGVSRWLWKEDTSQHHNKDKRHDTFIISLSSVVHAPMSLVCMEAKNCQIKRYPGQHDIFAVVVCGLQEFQQEYQHDMLWQRNGGQCSRLALGQKR
jgi:hypothetical protein